MSRLPAVAALLMALPVTSSAYEPPPDYVLASIRAYSKPDVLAVGVFDEDDCDANNDQIQSEIDAMLIRSRVARDRSSQVSLGVVITCMKTNTSQYVYFANPRLFVSFPEEADVEDIMLEIPLLRGSLGITSDPKDIEEAAVDAAERAVTDFIYAHSQGDVSN